MYSELVHYASGTLTPRPVDRAVARQGKSVYDEVRLAALKIDGAMALSAHIMSGLVTLDLTRQALSQGDPLQNMQLAEIQVRTMRKVAEVQESLYGRWAL